MRMWIPAFGDLCETRMWWSKWVRRVDDLKLTTPRPHPWIPAFAGMTVDSAGGRIRKLAVAPIRRTLTWN